MSCGRDWASWPRSTPVVSFPWNRSIRLNYHVNCFDILSFAIVAFGRSHLCEFGAASSVDELAAEVDGLRGICLQLLFHSHFLSPDTCRKARRRQRKTERERLDIIIRWDNIAWIIQRVCLRLNSMRNLNKQRLMGRRLRGRDSENNEASEASRYDSVAQAKWLWSMFVSPTHLVSVRREDQPS